MNGRRRRREPVPPEKPARVWVDSWQLECCGDAIAVGGDVSWNVVDADSEELRGVLGELASTVRYSEEHHGGSHGHGRSGGRTLEGRVARIDVVRTKYRPVEPGATLHVPDASTTHLEPADDVTGAEGATGYLVELLPEGSRVVWVYGDDLKFSLGDQLTLPVTGPDPEQLEQLLGTRTRLVTHQTNPWVEPLKLRKLTGTVTRIEMYRYAEVCEGDGADWAIVDGSQEYSEVGWAPQPPAASWRNQVGYLVTLAPDGTK